MEVGVGMGGELSHWTVDINKITPVEKNMR